MSSEPGVYFLGLPWLSRRGSSFIWGVWHDAKYLADHITTQRGYLAYRTSREPVPAATEPAQSFSTWVLQREKEQGADPVADDALQGAGDHGGPGEVPGGGNARS